ncbi:MAG: hypothetical protein HY854_20415 [Burkholderiales bacterium]|nr:hypothetical protein [Burkholderiales bacterium]
MALHPDAQRVEAARYALLRRLALAMRHHMVVHLQPMGMITELLERRLKAAEPDLAQVQEAMSKIHELSRAAVDSCLDVVTWLAPPAEVRVPLDDAVAECVVLLRSNFSFRGFPLAHQPGGATVEVSRAAVRHVLPAVLLALTDRAPAPAEVTVATTADGVVTVQVQPKAGDPGFPANHPYRLLDWQEVQTLAAADGVAVSRDASTARIRF